MRIWHYELLPYLPDLQFKGQLRELIAIMHDWKNKGTTNHLLINKVMDYSKEDLFRYSVRYNDECIRRYGKSMGEKYKKEFVDFCPNRHSYLSYELFKGWHTKEYLRSNMANLWEKHFMGVGKSRISDEEWETLLRGYKEITGEEYVI
jgi:uncharacterized protein (TIGR02328 family)